MRVHISRSGHGYTGVRCGVPPAYGSLFELLTAKHRSLWTLLVLGVLLVVITIAGLAGCTWRSESGRAGGSSAESLRTQAAALEEQGRTVDAIRAYRQIVKAYPQDHASWYRLALLERLSGDARRAVSHLRTAHKLAPKRTAYADDLARTLMTVGSYREAADVWGEMAGQRGLSDGRRGELLTLQGQALESAKDYRRALGAFKAALALTPGDTELKRRVAALE